MKHVLPRFDSPTAPRAGGAPRTWDRARVGRAAGIGAGPVVLRELAVPVVARRRRRAALLDVGPHLAELLARRLEPPRRDGGARRDGRHLDAVARAVDDARLVPQGLLGVLGPHLAGVADAQPAPVLGPREEGLERRLVLLLDPRVPPRAPPAEVDLDLGAVDLHDHGVEPAALAVARVDDVAGLEPRAPPLPPDVARPEPVAARRRRAPELDQSPPARRLAAPEDGGHAADHRRLVALEQLPELLALRVVVAAAPPEAVLAQLPGLAGDGLAREVLLRRGPHPDAPLVAEAAAARAEEPVPAAADAVVAAAEHGPRAAVRGARAAVALHDAHVEAQRVDLDVDLRGRRALDDADGVRGPSAVPALERGPDRRGHEGVVVVLHEADLEEAVALGRREAQRLVAHGAGLRGRGAAHGELLERALEALVVADVLAPGRPPLLGDHVVRVAEPHARGLEGILHLGPLRRPRRRHFLYS